MNIWKFADETGRVAASQDGRRSVSVDDPQIQGYLAAGGMIDPAFPLVETKARRVEQINAEAFQRITSKWPLWEQSNIALGLDPLNEQQCKDDIAAVRVAANSASDAVNAAVDIPSVQAVPVNWPVI